MKSNYIFAIVIVVVILISSYFQIDWKTELKETTFKNTIETDLNSKDSNFKHYTSVKQKSFTMGNDGRLETPTILNEQQLKIQQETGCFQNCHKEFK